MELIYPATFASAVASSRDLLEKISVIVGKYCGGNNDKIFMKACDSLDFKTANLLLDKTVEKLTGHDSVLVGLSDFVNKFQQIPELEKQVSMEFSERGKVEVINRYSDKILDIING